MMRPRRGSAVPLAAACFAAGLTAGLLMAPVGVSRGVEIATPPPRAEPAPTTPTGALRGGHPAEVIRVLDGDTFEARVRIWPGMDMTTRVRLRGIDAPEMRARCDDERLKAQAARDALTRILAEGTVGIARIGQDKYGGRRNSGAPSPARAAPLFRRPARELVRVTLLHLSPQAGRGKFHRNTKTSDPSGTRR